MRLKKLWILGLINLIFIISSFLIAKEVIDKGRLYDRYMHEHVEVLTFQDRLLNKDEWVLLISGKVISGIEDSVWEEKKITSAAKLMAAEENYELAKENAVWIVYGIVALLVVTLLLYVGSKKLFLALGGSFLSVSLILLYVGIFAPLIEIHAYNEDLKIPIVIKFDEMAASADDYINQGSGYVEEWSAYFGYEVDIPEYSPLSFLVDGYQYDHSVVFEGRMYFYFQSKSVDSIIELLFKDGNLTVGWAILLFSIVFPLLKLLLTSLLVYVPKARKSKILSIFLAIIGKWSMADIFVASVFLAYFSFHNMNSGIETQSQALLGLHFFLGYAVISIIASIMVWFATKQETKMKGYEAIL